MKRKFIVAFIALLVVMAGTLAVSWHASAHKRVADADDFTPGRLIDNSIMRRSGSMGKTDIQNFLENEMSEVGGCQQQHDTKDSWQDFGHDYRCLKNYQEDPTENMPECSDQYIEEQFEGKTGYDPDRDYNKAKTMCWWKGGRANFKKNDSTAMDSSLSTNDNSQKSAARLIKNVSEEHNINPQVILVLLQKEQSLVTDRYPWIIQYQSATGFGCPDHAGCDPDYRGFYNQINHAAKFFDRIMEGNGDNYYPPGDNDILYHPDYDKSDIVNIKNLATSALYNYTPYQPNQAALDNLYGTGNYYSTYGNRNFWRYFTDWFHPPAPSKYMTRMREEGSGKKYIINEKKDLKIRIAAPRFTEAWGLDKLPFPNVSSSKLDNYDDGGTLKRLAYERGTGKAFFADDGTAYHIKSPNQAQAWGLDLSSAPWLQQNTIDYTYQDTLSYRLGHPDGAGIYMMDSDTESGREIIRHYPSPNVLKSWEAGYGATPISEAYYCTSGSFENNDCQPRWTVKDGSEALGYPKATTGSINKTFFISGGNKHELTGGMANVYNGATTTLGKPALNRFSAAPEATVIISKPNNTKIYLMNQDTYHHLAGPSVYSHWEPGGDESKTRVPAAFTDEFLTESGSVSSFTATDDGTTTYYMEQDKYALEGSLEDAYTAPQSPMSVSAAVLDQYPDQNGIGTPYATSASTNKVFYLDGSGTKHHVGSFKKLRLMRSGTDQGTFVLPHGMIKGMNSGAGASFQFTSGGNTYVFDNGAYRKVASDEWELSPDLNVASSSLSDWLQEKSNLKTDFTVGDAYGIARNGVLHQTKNLALGEVWGADNNSTSISSRLTSFFEENDLSVLVSSQNPDNERLYLYDGNNLYHIPSLPVLKNFGLDRFGGNVKMTDTEIDNLESSEKATYLLSKSDGVIDDGKRRQFPVDNGETADAWFGSKTQLYTQKLVDLFAQKTADKKVSRLITSPETDKYYCMYDGEKRWLTGPSSKDNSQCSDKSLRGVSHKLLKQIPTGDNI